MVSLAQKEENQKVVSKLEVKVLLDRYKNEKKIEQGLINDKLKKNLKW